MKRFIKKLQNLINEHFNLAVYITVFVLIIIYSISYFIAESMVLDIISNDPDNISYLRYIPEILRSLVWNKIHIIPLLICAVVIISFVVKEHISDIKNAKENKNDI